MIPGRFFITPHAVKRFIEKCGGAMDYNDALADLIELSGRAHKVKCLHEGIELWRTGRPGRLRMVVSTRNAGLPQLVTVLNCHDKQNKRRTQ